MNADEIKRLRREVQSELEQMTRDQMCEDEHNWVRLDQALSRLAALEAENARLAARAKIIEAPADMEKARGALDRFINLAFDKDGERPRLSIPVNLDRDDDMILSDALLRLAALEAEVEKLRGVAEKARALLTCLETDGGFSEDKEAEQLAQFPEATPWLPMRDLRRALAALAPSDSSGVGKEEK